MNTIAWIGFSQGLFAAILMFTKKESSVSDKILSGWLFLLGFEFLTCGLDYEIYRQPLLSSSFLLFNPALYLYVKSLTKAGFRLRYIQLLHLLPFIVFEITAYILKEPLSLQSYFNNEGNYIYRMFFASATITSWTVYNPLSLILVHKHRISLQNEKSNIEKNEKLGWLLGLSIFYVVYCIVAFMLTVFVYGTSLNPLTPHIYNYSVLLFVIYVLSFYGLRQQQLKPDFQQKTNGEHYRNSQMTPEKRREICGKITAFIEQKKAYLDPELNMDTLSAAIKIPKYQITEALNTETGKNFFRFVNAYRVEAVKKMLADPKNKYSVEAVGYECGFASKSSFYTVFKNLTGQTPFEYRSTKIPG